MINHEYREVPVVGNDVTQGREIMSASPEPWTGEHAHEPSSIRAFEMKGLIPRTDPHKASAWAVENLTNLIPFWPVDSLLIIALVAEKRGIRFTGWVNDKAPANWYSDVVYALDPIMRIRRSNHIPTLAPARMEIVPRRVPRNLVLPDLMDDYADDSRALKNRYGRAAVALRNPDSMWEFLPLMSSPAWPGAAITYWLSPASEDIECQIVDDQWQSSFAGGSDIEWQMYRGTPIRARALLHGEHDDIPASVLAERMIMSQCVAARVLDQSDRRELARQDVACLKGSALPHMAVGSIMHFPAAAENRPVPGLKVLAPERRTVPYDAPPKPEHSLRFGRCVNSRQKHRTVWTSAPDLFHHMRLVGATGTGKSTAGRGLIREWVNAGYGALVIDPEGTLCEDLIRDIPDSDRLLYADNSDPEHVVPYNMLYARTPEQAQTNSQAFIATIASRWPQEWFGPVGQRSTDLINQGSREAWGVDANLVHTFTIVSNPDLSRHLAETVKLTNPTLAEQILREVASIRGDDNSSRWVWLASKGAEILGSKAFQRVLGTGAHPLNLRQAMDDSQCVLVNLGRANLGETPAQLLGCMLVAEFRLAMLARKDRTKPYLLFLDEAHLFQYGALPSLLDEARKFGVAIVVCHQRPDQLSFQVKDALAANASSYVQFRTMNREDAMEASLMLNGWPISDLTHLRDLTGVAVMSRNGAPSEPFSIEFDFFKRNAEQLADTELREWRAKQVKDRSYELLVKPYEHLEPVTPETIGEALKSARARIREAQTDAMRQAATENPIPPEAMKIPDKRAKLPDWLMS